MSLSPSTIVREALAPGVVDPMGIAATLIPAPRPGICVTCASPVSEGDLVGDPAGKSGKFSSGFTDDDRLAAPPADEYGIPLARYRCHDCMTLGVKSALARAKGLFLWYGDRAVGYKVGNGAHLNAFLQHALNWHEGIPDPVLPVPDWYLLAIPSSKNAQHLVWDAPLNRGGSAVVRLRLGASRVLTIRLGTWKECFGIIREHLGARGKLPLRADWGLQEHDAGWTIGANAEVINKLEANALTLGERWALGMAKKAPADLEPIEPLSPPAS